MLSFFFSSRRRHTSCGRDWSSDVCSSDLELLCAGQGSRHDQRERDPLLEASGGRQLANNLAVGLANEYLHCPAAGEADLERVLVRDPVRDEASRLAGENSTRLL